MDKEDKEDNHKDKEDKKMKIRVDVGSMWGRCEVDVGSM